MTQEQRVFDIQLGILKTELSHIDSAIRQHDEITKSVKNWAIVTWTASVGLALQDKNLHPFIWVTAVVPILFWIVDGTFRRIQRSFIKRIKQIRKFINSKEFIVAAENGTPIEFELLWMRDTTRKEPLYRTMYYRSVKLLYIGLSSLSFIVWFIVNR